MSTGQCVAGAKAAVPDASPRRLLQAPQALGSSFLALYPSSFCACRRRKASERSRPPARTLLLCGGRGAQASFAEVCCDVCAEEEEMVKESARRRRTHPLSLLSGLLPAPCLRACPTCSQREPASAPHIGQRTRRRRAGATAESNPQEEVCACVGAGTHALQIRTLSRSVVCASALRL